MGYLHLHNLQQRLGSYEEERPVRIIQPWSYGTVIHPMNIALNRWKTKQKSMIIQIP